MDEKKNPMLDNYLKVMACYVPKVLKMKNILNFTQDITYGAQERSIRNFGSRINRYVSKLFELI